MNAEIISTNGRSRLRIQLPLRAPAPAKKERRQWKTFDFGNIRIPYAHYEGKTADGKKYSYWQLAHGRGKRRKIESRVSFAKLKSRAQELAIDITNGKTAMSQFTEEHRATFLRCCELAAEVHAPLELLVAEAVEARKKSLATKHLRKTVPEVVTEFLAQKDKELKRKKWYRSLSKMVNRFAEYFTGKIDDVKAHDINAWLRSLPGGPDYRRHHREAVSGLVSFAKGANYLPRDWEELKLVDNPKSDPVKIRTWTADQVLELLAHTQENMIPFTVLQVFAGIRHEEINPEEFDLAKTPLDWCNFDWERKLIHVTEDTAKMGEDRLIPMEENLIAWLQTRAKASGPVCKVRNTSNALSRAKHRAKLPAGRSQSRNVLRKTWISARLAIVKNIGQVAEEAGNSVAKIKSNYRRPMSEAAAKRIFNIHPTSADILQARFAI